MSAPVHQPAMPAIVEMLKGLTPDRVKEFVDGLTPEQCQSIACDRGLWALPHQNPPPGSWRRWLLRCGRFAGKTHTGSSVTNDVAKDRSKIRTGEIGICGRNYHDARFVMVEGPSGILATASPDFRPRWEPGNMLLTWPNDVRGRLFTADKMESGRGGNWSFVWADEPAFWPDLRAMWWEVIEPALRIGWARAVLTTTPIKDPALREIEDDEGTVTTTASYRDNPYVADEVKDTLRRRYEGTRIGRQELEGEYLDESEFALWTPDLIEAYRVTTAPVPFRRVVIAVDPAVTANEKSDETGIVVIGKADDGHGYPVQDRSLRGSPLEWARRAVAAYHRWDADVLVAEVNNGGDLVETNIHAIDPRVNVKMVRASRGKVMRAEPVVALYERGLVHHVGHLEQLEDQMVTWEPHRASKLKSPDRLDALVWGLTELYLDDPGVGPLRGYL